MVDVVVDPEFYYRVRKYEQETDRYKEYRRRWNDNPKNNVVESFPIHLDIEVTNACNYKCYMCFQAFDPPKYGFMDFDLFKKMIDEGEKHGLCSIKLLFRGEPLLHKDIVKMVAYAKQHGVIEVAFNTNASLLTESRAREFIEAGLDKIVCSVDGCTKEVYERIRIGGNFDVVLGNIKRLQEFKKEMGVSHPIVRVQMVDTPKNHHQIPEYIEFWGKIADQVATEALYEWEHMAEDPSVSKEFCCAQLWQRLMILWNGDVVLCCGDNRGRLRVGNVMKDNLADIWQSERLKVYRGLHLKGESHKMEICRRCGLRKSYIVKKSAELQGQTVTIMPSGDASAATLQIKS